MVPMVASVATQVLMRNVPISVRNSPTKPEAEARHRVYQPAIGRDFARVHAVVDDTNTEEQSSRNDAMRDHLENAPGDALRRHRDNPHGDEAHMRDGGIGD